MERWVGKTAIVTGASAGIGAAIAVSLANAGLNVVGLARRPQLIEELSKQIEPGKGKIFARKCDVSSREQIVETFAAICEQFGGINIVVNNAAYLKSGTLTDVGQLTVSDEDIDGVVKTNLIGLVTCCREAVKYMKQTGEQGHIVNVGSIAGNYVLAGLGMPSFNIYYGTKFAVHGITEAMRLEFSHSKTNIKITYVAPAIVQTDIFTSGGLGNIDRDIAKGACASLQPSDIAYAVLGVIGSPPRCNVSEVVVRPMGDII